ncbi:MAG: hypothetical protein ACOCR6_01855 [archaeon]
MSERFIGLEVLWIRLRGLFWTFLQALALASILVGAIRFFAPVLHGPDNVIVQGVYAAYAAVGFLPGLGPSTYLFGGLVATLVISWLR